MRRICAQFAKAMDFPASQRLRGCGYTTPVFRHRPQVCRTLATLWKRWDTRLTYQQILPKGVPRCQRTLSGAEPRRPPPGWRGPPDRSTSTTREPELHTGFSTHVDKWYLLIESNSCIGFFEEKWSRGHLPARHRRWRRAGGKPERAMAAGGTPQRNLRAAHGVHGAESARWKLDRAKARAI